MHRFNSLESAISESQLLEIEKEINVELPKDYKEFLLRVNVGIPKDNYLSFFVDELHEEVTLGVLLGCSENKNFSLLNWNLEYCDELPEGSLIFATGYGGGLFVMITTGEDKGIYFWDHSFIFDQSSEESNVYFLKDNFTSFIADLYFQKLS